MEYAGYGIYSNIKDKPESNETLIDTKVKIKPSCKQIELDAESVYDFVIDKFENIKE